MEEKGRGRGAKEEGTGIGEAEDEVGSRKAN